MCLEVPNHRAENTPENIAYFNDLHDLTRKHPDTPAAFMAYLLEVEVDTDLVHKPLKTDMRRNLRFEHLPHRSLSVGAA